MRSSWMSYHHQMFFISACWITALLTSAEFLLSMSMLATLLVGIFEWNKGKIKIRPIWKNFKQTIREKRDWWWWTVPFLLVLFTSVYSTEDYEYLLERLRIKIPFLILPFAFAAIPRVPRKFYLNLHYLFFILYVITSFGVLGNYILDFEAINEAISKGQPVPTPTNHIRYSLMGAFATFVGFFLFRDRHTVKNPIERWLILGSTIYLLTFLHVLSVRSGLAVFYLTMGFLICRHIILTRRLLVGTVALVGLVALPIIAYYSLPSFQQKIAYMRWDFQQFQQGKGETYSDSERLHSLMMGVHIIKENPLLGVGAGDVKHQVMGHYDKHLPELPQESKKMPHNQFISVWAGTGLIGLAFFVLSLLIPLFKKRRLRNKYLLAFFLISFFSFLVENTIENAIGIGLFLLFILWGMVLPQEEHSPEIDVIATKK